MKKTTKKTEHSSKMPCTGCGRHAKFVTPNVNCLVLFTLFLQKMVTTQIQSRDFRVLKPCENIRVKDVLLGADGRNYKVVVRDYNAG